jgi:bifunctional ADP-heptose synthase (sugar kinase/adenylyltransferase)
MRPEGATGKSRLVDKRLLPDLEGNERVDRRIMTNGCFEFVLNTHVSNIRKRVYYGSMLKTLQYEKATTL